jgi:hypothetical protein
MATDEEISRAPLEQLSAMNRMDETLGTPQWHDAMHEFIDWTVVKSFGRHALPHSETCPEDAT